MENSLRCGLKRGLRCGLKRNRHVALYPLSDVGGFTVTSDKNHQT